MNRLQLRLLGSPKVTFADGALKFRSRKVLGLFIYLAVTGQRQPRDKLVELLWPTSDPQRGMASLRNTITRLRKALAPAGDFLTAETPMSSSLRCANRFPKASYGTPI